MKGVEYSTKATSPRPERRNSSVLRLSRPQRPYSAHPTVFRHDSGGSANTIMSTASSAARMPHGVGKREVQQLEADIACVRNLR